MKTVTLPLEDYELMQETIRSQSKKIKENLLKTASIMSANMKLEERQHKIALILGMTEVKEETI